MSDRPTPETDSHALKAEDIDEGGNFEAVHANIARRLERERDEAQDAALEMEFRLNQAERRNVEHEGDYLAVWRAIKRPNETVLEACNRILRQRDELLEALEACRYDSCELLGERALADSLAVIVNDCRPFCEPMRQRLIDTALAAWKEARNDT